MRFRDVHQFSYLNLQKKSTKDIPITSTISTNFNGLETKGDLIALNNYLSDTSYISGFGISIDDISVARRLERINENDPGMRFLNEPSYK